MKYFFNFIVTTVSNTVTYFFNIVLFQHGADVTFGHTILYFGLASLALGFFLSFFRSAGKGAHSYAREQRFNK